MAKKKKKSKSLKNSSNENISAAAQEAAEKAAREKAAQEAEQKAILAAAQQQAQLGAAVAAASASPGTFGAFGSSIIFQVSDPYNDAGGRSIAVPSQIQRESRGRWRAYNLLGKKPLKSFEGPDSTQVTLTITLDSDHGINPRAMLDNIQQAIQNGTVDYLVIGGRIVGGARYYIESMSETWERFFQGGRLTRATGDITFSEYV